jgi:hypothetical protein
VQVKVSAINAYGEGDFSEVGSGAVHEDVPSAPFNLQNIDGTTDSTKIAFSWVPSTYVGGTPIIDYRIQYALVSGDYSTLDTGVITTTYTTYVTLVAGESYKFQV